MNWLKTLRRHGIRILLTGTYKCKYFKTMHLKSSRASWIMLRTKFIWTEVSGAPLLTAPDVPGSAAAAAQVRNTTSCDHVIMDTFDQVYSMSCSRTWFSCGLTATHWRIVGELGWHFSPLIGLRSVEWRHWLDVCTLRSWGCSQNILPRIISLLHLSIVPKCQYQKCKHIYIIHFHNYSKKYVALQFQKTLLYKNQACFLNGSDWPCCSACLYE